MIEDLTLGGQMQYTDGIWQNYTLQTYITLLSNDTPIILIKIKYYKIKF